MGTTTTNLAAVLLEKVNMVAESGAELKAVTWPRIEKLDKKDAMPDSKPFRIPWTPYENPSEAWASAQGFDYAVPSQRTYTAMYVSYTRMSGSCSFSNDVVQLNEENQTAIFNTVTTEVSKKSKQLAKRFNKYALGDGSGELGRVSTVNSATVLTFATTGNLFGVWNLQQVGQRIQFYNPAGTVQRTGGGVYISTITAYDSAAKTVTFDQLPNDISTASTGDIAVAEGAANNVFRGIKYHINNSGTYQTISRATYPELNATVVSAAAAPLSLSILAKSYAFMIYKVNEAGTNGTLKTDGFVWLFPPGQCQAYTELGFPRQAIQQGGSDANGNLDMGFSGLAYNGTPILQEVDQDIDQIALVNFGKLMKLQLKALSAEQFTGGGIFWPRNAASGQGYSDGQDVYLTMKMETASSNPKEVGLRVTALAVAGLANPYQA